MRISSFTAVSVAVTPALTAAYVVDRVEKTNLAGERAILTSTVPPVMSPGYKLRATSMPECESTVVPNLFGEIQNFAAATSLCSSFLAPYTRTVTTTTTVAAGMDANDVKIMTTPQPSFPMVSRDPTKASAACSCLIGSAAPLTVTVTATKTAEPRKKGMSDEQQFRFLLSAMRDRGALAVPTLDSRYGKPVRHID